MSTVSKPARRRASAARLPVIVDPPEQRIVIRNVDWDLYDRLSDALGERQHVYMAFDGEDLEIMTKGFTHEDYKDLLGRFVNAVTFELRVRCRGAGETTWKRPRIKRGVEADNCYFFLPKKLAMIAKARARKSNEVSDYPNPDLAVEVELTEPLVDRIGIYAKLQVAELWRFNGDKVTIDQLQPDGTYKSRASSQFLTIRAEEILRWIAVEDSGDELGWELRLREWARTELAPRLKS
jgi:Uma2 family endonuclease